MNNPGPRVSKIPFKDEHDEMQEVKEASPQDKPIAMHV